MNNSGYSEAAGLGLGDEADDMPSTEKDLAEDAPWKKIQQNTFTRWCNEHLKCVNKRIGNLQTDLSDGLRLIALLEVLSQKRMYRKYHQRPTFRQMQLENVSVALEFLDRESIKLVSIGECTAPPARAPLRKAGAPRRAPPRSPPALCCVPGCRPRGCGGAGDLGPHPSAAPRAASRCGSPRGAPRGAFGRHVSGELWVEDLGWGRSGSGGAVACLRTWGAPAGAGDRKPPGRCPRG